MTAASPAVDASQFDCAICQNLLLDPVVAPCGHDYCQTCLAEWRGTQRRTSNVACPLCREPVPDGLGVCVRLRETIQLLFPDKVAERRIELKERKERRQAGQTSSGPAVAGPPEPAIVGRARPGEGDRIRRRLASPRLERTPPFQHGASELLAWPPSRGAIQIGGPPRQHSLFSPPPQLSQMQTTLGLGVGASGPVNAAALSSPVPAPGQAWAWSGSVAPAAAAAAAGAPAAAPAAAWQPPAVVSFSLGWYDISECRNKRTASGRRRRSLRAV